MVWGRGLDARRADSLAGLTELVPLFGRLTIVSSLIRTGQWLVSARLASALTPVFVIGQRPPCSDSSCLSQGWYD